LRLRGCFWALLLLWSLLRATLNGSPWGLRAELTKRWLLDQPMEGVVVHYLVLIVVVVMHVEIVHVVGKVVHAAPLLAKRADGSLPCHWVVDRCGGGGGTQTKKFSEGVPLVCHLDIGGHEGGEERHF